MLYTPRNDHDVALAADPLFAAEAELHLSLEHPDDVLIGVTVRLDMDTGPDAPNEAGLRKSRSRTAAMSRLAASIFQIQSTKVPDQSRTA
jgi:hypothetical protein